MRRALAAAAACAALAAPASAAQDDLPEDWGAPPADAIDDEDTPPATPPEAAPPEAQEEAPSDAAPADAAPPPTVAPPTVAPPAVEPDAAPPGPPPADAASPSAVAPDAVSTPAAPQAAPSPAATPDAAPSRTAAAEGSAVTARGREAWGAVGRRGVSNVASPGGVGRSVTLRPLAGVAVREVVRRVPGHRYARIVTGPRAGLYVNLTRNARRGMAFALLAGGVHVYTTPSGRIVVRVSDA